MSAPASLVQRLRAAAWWRGRAAADWLRDHAGNLWHRWIGYRNLRVTPGAAAQGDRVAIYLLFPTQGLRDSHVLAIDALRRGGCAVVAVSNLPLAPADRVRLANLCHAVIERPNVGYDFGAYLDAIRWLKDALPRLRQLVLMNDSVWYPVPGTADWPSVALAHRADVVGAVWNYGVAQPDLGDWQSYRWQVDASRPGFHYCSFALSFGPGALRAPAFRQFWRRLVLTDDKIRTVRRGEVGLSQALLGASLSHACTLDLSGLEHAIDAMPEPALRQFVTELVVPQDPALEALRTRVLAETAVIVADQPGGAERAHAMLRSLALVTIAAVGPAYAMPGYLIAAHGYPFLKKSPLRLAPAGAGTTLAVADRLPGTDGATIAAEARALASGRQDGHAPPRRAGKGE